jgi:hypothetical protein
MGKRRFKAETYDNGHGWRIAFDFMGARRVLTYDEAEELAIMLNEALHGTGERERP